MNVYDLFYFLLMYVLFIFAFAEQVRRLLWDHEESIQPPATTSEEPENKEHSNPLHRRSDSAINHDN